MTMRSKVFSAAGRLVPGRVKDFTMRAAFAAMSEAQQYRMREHYQMATMPWSLRNLQRLGFHPRWVVDVGAYQGYWSALARSLWPEARVLMVEANPAKAATLRRIAESSGGLVAFEAVLLGPEPRATVEFQSMETGSSVLYEKSDAPREALSLPMTTLDEAARWHGVAGESLLKLDVQGYELEVLKGGRNTLETAGAVLMEVSFLGVIQGAPLVREVLDFMGEAGFHAYDICGLSRRPLDGALWQADMIFLPERSPLLTDLSRGRGLPCTIPGR